MATTRCGQETCPEIDQLTVFEKTAANSCVFCSQRSSFVAKLMGVIKVFIEDAGFTPDTIYKDLLEGQNEKKEILRAELKEALNKLNADLNKTPTSLRGHTKGPHFKQSASPVG